MSIRKTDAQLLAELLDLLRRDPRIRERQARVQFIPGTRVLEIAVGGHVPWTVLVDADLLREDFGPLAEQILATWDASDHGRM